MPKPIYRKPCPQTPPCKPENLCKICRNRAASRAAQERINAEIKAAAPKIRCCADCHEWRTYIGASGRCQLCGRKPRSPDWSAKADAYFASQIDPGYYRDRKLQQHLEALGGLR